MKPTLDLTLPYPPVTGNHMWKHAKGAHYLVKEARDFYVVMGQAVRMQGAALELNQPLSITVTLHPPDRRRRDMDNAWKVIGDALTKARVWQDDAQIRSKLIQWAEPIKGGRVLVSIAQHVEESIQC